MSAAAILVFLALGGLVWRLSALLLGALAWLVVGIVALSLLAGVATPTAAVLLAVGLWLASQASTRVRRGYWRSGGLRAAGRAADAVRAARP